MTLSSHFNAIRPALPARRSVAVAVAVVLAMAGATASVQAAGTEKPAMATPVSASTTNSYHAVRASKVVGMNVHGAAGKDVGKIKDLIIDTHTSAVRYAVLEFDPGFFKSDKLFAVPLSSLSFVSDDKPLIYKDVTKAQLDRASVDKADWEKARDNSRYIAALDQNYGYKPPSGDARAMRASKLIGKDVNNRAGKDIGDIQDLVLDMGANKVDYAVLAFDPSWFAKEKMFAFPLSAFTAARDKDDLVLDVDKAKLEAMKNFDASRWGRLNDLNRDEFVNRPVVKR